MADLVTSLKIKQLNGEYTKQNIGVEANHIIENDIPKETHYQKASHDYDIGDLFSWGGKLYEAVVPIGIGDILDASENGNIKIFEGKNTVLTRQGTWENIVDYRDYAEKTNHIIYSEQGIPNTTIHPGELVYITLDLPNYLKAGVYIYIGKNDIIPPDSIKVINQDYFQRAEESKIKIFAAEDYEGQGFAMMPGLVPPIDYKSKDEGLVLQSTGWGHKLQTDIVFQDGKYGYIDNSTSEKKFVPFESQTEILAAVAAAKKRAAYFRMGRMSTMQNLVQLPDPVIGWTSNSFWGNNKKETDDLGKYVCGCYVWSDGENTYYSQGGEYQFILNPITYVWENKEWSGLDNISELRGNQVFKLKDNIYLAGKTKNYMLNKATGKWEKQNWSIIIDTGGDVWTDGCYYYYSNRRQKENYRYSIDEWVPAIESREDDSPGGLYPFVGQEGEEYHFSGEKIWTDGQGLYYSDAMENKFYKIEGNFYNYHFDSFGWHDDEGKTFSFDGSDVWTTGINIYVTRPSGALYKLKNGVWSQQCNKSLVQSPSYIWSDGKYIFYDEPQGNHLVLQYQRTPERFFNNLCDN